MNGNATDVSNIIAIDALNAIARTSRRNFARVRSVAHHIANERPAVGMSSLTWDGEDELASVSLFNARILMPSPRDQKWRTGVDYSQREISDDLMWKNW